MKSIEELASSVADAVNSSLGLSEGPTDDWLEKFASLFLAAYAEQQEPVAWSYCPECGSEEIHYEQGTHKQCKNCHQEWFSDLDYSDVVQTNLSKLYAAPVVPDGMVLVPREPTEAMVGNEWNRDMLSGIYKAMIAAGEKKS